MSSFDVEQIKERLAIADIIGSYIQLQKAGKNFKARCPFHNEKTPSFIVSPDRGTYHCFGCQKGGDIFSFVQEIEGLDFSGALKILAERAGVTLSRQVKGDSEIRNRLFLVMKAATLWYERNLYTKKKVGLYLKERGLSGETAKLFSVGYALDEWQALYDYLLTKKFTVLEMENAGLITSSPKGHYDRFRGRIMFPIFDSAGRVVAFSGRIFDTTNEKTAAKYVNSPETKLYNKSDILYGFHLAKNSIRKENACIFVEGQMDIIMSHQAGINNCVAVSGTALTEGHLKRVQKLAETVIFAFDGDDAGQRAMDKAVYMALKLGFLVRVIPLPKGTDPADFIKHNPNDWKTLVEDALEVIEYKIAQVEMMGSNSIAIRKKVRESILPYLVQLSSSIDQGYYVSRIAGLLHIHEDAVWEDLRKVNMNIVDTEISKISSNASQSRIDKIVFKLTGLLEWIKENKVEVKNIDEVSQTIKKQMAKTVEEALIHKDALLYEVELYLTPENDIQKQLDDLYHNYTQEYLSLELEKLSDNISKEQTKGNTEEEMELLEKYNELLKQKK